MSQDKLQKAVETIKSWHHSNVNFQSLSDKSISLWEEADIKLWLSYVRGQKDRYQWCTSHLCQIIAVASRGVELSSQNKCKLKDTQYMSLFLLLDAVRQKRGRVGQVLTGEGKTIIMAIFAIILSLFGKPVDMVTSSTELAERDSKISEALFDIFDVTVSNNCDHDCQTSVQTRKSRYLSHVVYGDLAAFQRDFLLSEFLDQPVSDRISILNVDEVDNMFLDKSKNVLYLSHDIPDLQCLLPIYVYIWLAVNGHMENDFNEQVRDFIKNEIDQGNIVIPKKLEAFVYHRLSGWIESALVAKNATEDDCYSIQSIEDQNETSRRNKIVPMDKDTGVEQMNTHWDRGVHQFLQLKHLLEFSPEGLKAFYISNHNFFLRNKGQIYGLSGTLGTDKERELLQQTYSLDSFNVPRSKAADFLEEEGMLSSAKEEWLDYVLKDTKNKVKDNRAVLIVCENKVTVHEVKEKLKKIAHLNIDVHVYESVHQHFDLGSSKENPLRPRQIIVATNIGGRGTNLLIDEELKRRGGLHVIMTQLANLRVILQAFGRGGRNEDPGTCRLIVFHEEPGVSLSQLRKNYEIAEQKKLEQIRTKDLPSVDMEYYLLEKRFKELFKSMRKKLNDLNKNPNIKEYQDYVEIQLKSLKDHWAYWLDYFSEETKNISPSTKEKLDKAFDEFEIEMNKLFEKAEIRLVTSPHELMNLGNYFLKNSNLGLAQECFQAITENDENRTRLYSEAAHIYMANLIYQQKKHTSLEVRRSIKKSLQYAEKIIQTKIYMLAQHEDTLSFIAAARQRDQGERVSGNQYETQMKDQCKLLAVHLDSVHDIMGHDFSPNALKRVFPSVEEEDITSIRSAIVGNPNIFKPTRFSKKIIINSAQNKSGRNKTKLSILMGDQEQEIKFPKNFSYLSDSIAEFIFERINKKEFFMLKHQDFFRNHIVTRGDFLSLLKEHHFFVQPYRISMDADIEQLNLKEFFNNDEHIRRVKNALCVNRGKFFDKLIFDEEIMSSLGNDRFAVFKVFLLKKRALLESFRDVIQVTEAKLEEVDFRSLHIPGVKIKDLKKMLLEKNEDVFDAHDFDLDVKKIDKLKTILLQKKMLVGVDQYVISVTESDLEKIDFLSLGISDDRVKSLKKTLLEQNEHILDDSHFDLDAEEFKKLKNILLEQKMLRIADQLTWLSLWFDKDSRKISRLPQELQKYHDLLLKLLPNPEKINSGIVRVLIDPSMIPLPEEKEKSCESLLLELKRQGVVKEPAVAFSLEAAVAQQGMKKWLGNQEKEVRLALKSFFESKLYTEEVCDQYVEKVVNLLGDCAGKLKSLADFKTEWKPIEEYFTQSTYPNPREIFNFQKMHLGRVLCLELQRPFWDWNIFLLAMFGLVQIIAGVTLGVFTAGLGSQVALGLIALGISDIVYAIQTKWNNSEINWGSYAKQKGIAVALTVLCFGVGYLGGFVAEVGAIAEMSAGSVIAEIASSVVIRAGQAVATALGCIFLQNVLSGVPAEIASHLGGVLFNWFSDSKDVAAVFNRFQQAMDSLCRAGYSVEEATTLIKSQTDGMFQDLSQHGARSEISQLGYQLVDEIAVVVTKLIGVAAQMPDVTTDKVSSFVGWGVNGVKVAFETYQHNDGILKVLTQMCEQLEDKAKCSEKSTVVVSKKQQQELNAFYTQHVESIKTRMTQALLQKVNKRIVTPEIQSRFANGLETLSQICIKRIRTSIRTQQSTEVAALESAINQYGGRPAKKRRRHKKNEAMKDLRNQIKRLGSQVNSQAIVRNQGNMTVKQFQKQNLGRADIYVRRNSAYANVAHIATRMVDVATSTVGLAVKAVSFFRAYRHERQLEHLRNQRRNLSREVACLVFFAKRNESTRAQEESKKQTEHEKSLARSRSQQRVSFFSQMHEEKTNQLHQLNLPNIRARFLSFVQDLCIANANANAFDGVALIKFAQELFDNISAEKISGKVADVFEKLEDEIHKCPDQHQHILYQALSQLTPSFAEALNLEMECDMLAEWQYVPL